MTDDSLNQSLAEHSAICGYSDTYWAACDLVTQVTYTFLPPISFAFGMTGHILAIRVFLHDKSLDRAYSYQLLTAAAKICEIIAISWFILFFTHGADQGWSGEGLGDGPAWFVHNHSLMWLTAHFTPYMASASVSIPILASAATSVDRVFAMYRPLAYRKIKCGRHVVIAAIACFLIPLLSESNVLFTFDSIPVDDDVGKYKIVYSEFAASNTGSALSRVSVIVRSIGETILITSNIAMVYLFKQRNKKVQNMIIKDAWKEEKRKSAERTLFVLALFQSAATTVPALLQTVWDLGIFFSPSFQPCVAPMLSPMTDLLLQVINAMDFYFMALVSKTFRKICIRALRRSHHSSV